MPTDEGVMPLLSHLEELRGRLLKIVLAFIVLSVLAWFLYDRVLAVLVEPLKSLPEADQIFSRGRLVFIGAPTEALFLRLKVTAFVGFVLALPVVLWQLWRFVTPGLYAREKTFAVAFVSVAMILFAAGAVFAHLLLPQALRILYAFAGTEAVILPRASDYLSFVMLLVAAFGITFELPLVLISLSLVGVLPAETLQRGRKIAWIALLALAAIVTPTADPLTMLLLGIPLILLYEVTVLVAKFIRRRRLARGVG